MIDFKGSQFEKEIILWGVRWYVAYPISYRQLEEMIGSAASPSITRPSIAGSSSMRQSLKSSSAAGSSQWGRVGGWMRGCHERIARVLECDATQKMREGPSEPAYRRRLQTTLSCNGKEPLW